MLKYMLLLYVVPVKNDLPEVRNVTLGSAEADDYPAFSTHNFTVFETGGFTIKLPLSQKHSLQNIYIYYTVNQKLSLENVVRIANTGVFIRDEKDCCWKYTGLSLVLKTGDEFEYILQLNGFTGDEVKKQYRKIIDKLLPDKYRSTGDLPKPFALNWYNRYEITRKKKH